MELPKRKKNRLELYDYSTANGYFITICSCEKRNLFWQAPTFEGECRGGHWPPVSAPEDVPLTELGVVVQQKIHQIPARYPAVTVDRFVIMPNHVHLLLQIHSNADGRPMAAPTVSNIINQLTGAVSKQAGFSVWQKGFYDHVIRGDKDYLDVWNYIDGNPGKWTEDDLYTDA